MRPPSSSANGLGSVSTCASPKHFLLYLCLIFVFAFLSWMQLLQQRFAVAPPSDLVASILSDSHGQNSNSSAASVSDLMTVNAPSSGAARVRSLECIKWRQTGRCDPDGPREPHKDKDCDEFIHAGVSGYCEVLDPTTNETFRVMLSGCRSIRGNAKFKCAYAPEFGNFALNSQLHVDKRLADPSYALPHLAALPANASSGSASDVDVSSNETTAGPNPNERGIVMVVYPRLLAGIYATVRVLRARNCVLPIEFWYRPDELSTDGNAILQELVNKFGPISLHPIEDPNARRFKSKIYAIYNSRFHNVMFLDADNAPVRDPTFLFDTKMYKENGAIFWPDYWNPRNSMFDINKSSLLWQLVGVPFTEMFEQESAQLLINRRIHASALEMLHFYAFSEPNFFDSMRLVWGDKDLFRLAWLKTNSSFFMVTTPPAIGGRVKGKDFCGMTMIQHDPNGEILFMHRNKMKLDGLTDETSWSHVQKFKADAPLEEYVISWKRAKRFFGDLDLCYDADGSVLEYFDLIPMQNLSFTGFEDEIIAYAAESTKVLNDNE